MATNEKLINVLNNLIEINNDRIVGYEKAEQESKSHDSDLQAIFHSMANDSRKFVRELTQAVINLGGEFSTDTTNKGKVYRVWMDIKATFAGNDRQAMLDACEFGEDAAQRAYTDALNSSTEISPQIRTIIAEQQATLKTAHDLVKRYGNAYHNANA
ncbi:MAG: PA2169 family four-helix-bundle protein [Ferruginibacter sp.]